MSFIYRGGKIVALVLSIEADQFSESSVHVQHVSIPTIDEDAICHRFEDGFKFTRLFSCPALGLKQFRDIVCDENDTIHFVFRVIQWGCTYQDGEIVSHWIEIASLNTGNRLAVQCTCNRELLSRERFSIHSSYSICMLCIG